MSYTRERIEDLLDFSTPNVGYEDEKKRSVCGCCGTYFVVSPGELAHAQEVMKEMYEALKALLAERTNIGLGKPFWTPGVKERLEQSLAKAEGEE